MPGKKRGSRVWSGAADEELLGQLAFGDEADAGDWDAAGQFEWGRLIASLRRTDAGVMFRSSMQGRGVAVGVFLGSAKRWTTCVDVREFLAVLEAFQEGLEGRIAAVPVPRPTKKARAAQTSL